MNSRIVEYNTSINSEFTKICKPLLEHFGITHFIYIRIHDNKRIYLSNSVDWVDYYVNHKLFNDQKHEQQAIVPTIKSQYAFWNGYKIDGVFSAAHEFGMWNGFIIYQGDEIFSFATRRENTEISNLYLNNLKMLEHFILYFKSRARHLIHPKNPENILITKDVPKINTSILCPSTYQKFLRDTKITKYNLTAKNIDIFISKRQTECLYHLSHGKSAKEIGRVLDLSPRTVEKYIENVKDKLGSCSTSKLIDIFSKSILHDVIYPNSPIGNE